MSDIVTEMRDPASLFQSPRHRRVRVADLDGLAASIEVHGVIEPLVIRPTGEVIAGERRRQAAIARGIAEVPCIVRDVDDATAVTIQYEENAQRVDAHYLDEADLIAQLADMGHEPGAIAGRFAIARRRVARRLALRGLSSSLRAFAASGEMDEPGAVAAALLTHAQQDDVAAALRAGAMRGDEVEAHCRREFTAPLSDVPWRVSDPDVVPAAGACTACPKRSGQQRDLFAEAPADRCVDVACYRNKMAAAYERSVSLVPADRLVRQDQSSLFMPGSAGQRPVVLRSSGYVDAEAPCPHLPGLSWSEAVEACSDPQSRPTEYVARDHDGRPRYLMLEKSSVRLVRRSDAAQTVAAADPVLAEQARDRDEAKVRRAVVEQLAARVDQAVDENADDWTWVVERVIEGATPRAVSAAAHQLADVIAARAEGDADAGGLRALARVSNRCARRVAVAVQLREEASVDGDLPDSVRELAKSCGVDLRRLEERVRKEREP